MTDLNKELAEKLEKVLEDVASESTMKGVMKSVQSIKEELEADLMYRLKDELSYYLSAYVQEMAGKAVNALLRGDDDAMCDYLSCKDGSYTGRGGSTLCPRPVHEHHSVIHGKLFETGAIELRKKVVAANRDLIESQRILDLEDQVASLVAQVNKLAVEKEEVFKELREYRRYSA